MCSNQVDPTLLSSFNELAYYSAHFMDLHFWEPFLRQVCSEHGFDSSRVKTGVPGTYPTFMVEGNYHISRQHAEWVVKFFGPLFDGENAFHKEREWGIWLETQPMPIVSPRILGEGCLNRDWHYLVFTAIPGISVGQARHLLSRDDQYSIAEQMGEYAQQLHYYTAENGYRLPSPVRPSVVQFQRFIQDQLGKCTANHRMWNDLPGRLIDQLGDLGLRVEELIDFSAPPHCVHADLTADHLLGEVVNGKWHSLAIIDWGDSCSGNILFELVALFIDLFRGDKQLLSRFLGAYHLPDFFRRDFPRKALGMCLLHPFPMPDFISEGIKEVPSLREMADQLFAI